MSAPIEGLRAHFYRVPPGIRPLHPWWIEPEPVEKPSNPWLDPNFEQTIATKFVTCGRHLQTASDFDRVRWISREFILKPLIDKIVAFWPGSLVHGSAGVTRHSALLMMRERIGKTPGYVRILVHDLSYTEDEKAILRLYDIEPVTICEAILAVDRRSLVFLGSPEVPIVDIICDLPERPAILLTNYFSIKDSGYVEIPDTLCTMLTVVSLDVIDEVLQCKRQMPDCQFDEMTGVQRVVYDLNPRPRAMKFIQNYKCFDLRTNFQLGPDAAEFCIYFRKDPVTKFAWILLDDPPDWYRLSKEVTRATKAAMYMDESWEDASMLDDAEDIEDGGVEIVLPIREGGGNGQDEH